MNQEMTTFKYDTAFGNVELDFETVKKYLVKGKGNVSDEEIFLYCNMCKAQKINPFVTGEAYLIKYGDQAAQMVIGYDTYKRRAEENPSHLFTESGIVVVRGSSGEVVTKKGACLYPTETLIGGWCEVHKMKSDREVKVYKEVGLAEYDKKNAIWKEKPCTMIEKVAISQCLREAYPKDYEGLYTPEEIAPTEYVEYEECETKDELITQEERKALFAKAQEIYGKEVGNNVVKKLMEEYGLESTANMTKSTYQKMLDIMEEDKNAELESASE